MKDFTVLENLLGYSFKSICFLKKALTHSSYLNESNTETEESNEKLEFLGDSVLELVVREYSIEKFPENDIGAISKFKSMIVSDRFLSRVGKGADLGNHLMLGRGEDAAGGRLRDSIIAAALEAVIGAVYLDGGLEQARLFVLKKIIKKAESSEFLDLRDYKSRLQEVIQKEYNTFPVYSLIEEMGPVHDKTFRICLEVNKNPVGYGSGKSIKEAEQRAAKEALEKLEIK
ncbi:MAG: ribonuclease III [Candidatus Schekmanbacteria bacterium GWA2_38_9]|uniref:Ribonuclease 3 n=1 Tax=Candidatus Schekmanbacteria bacterium RIFCSPLOWO2_12_FULL_38_15 TaxID=1817883 RepID=A0A1F7SLT1_9BACT|nr:MAG: ribonuclease III [Candidatus Schekmanbacteria bacterium GWA2_38_9]OGL48289.1 MAG: ribonuclease III [Candidatus Schekmanbacteria bacterium RIFCSPLOWO2_02_FULL_38_14]OGL54157.1 MAG: ribonuclease III [Candidatus Schekmanbacteria bacterium RIFCSPLOWO2_12_FULL_38_15]